MKKILFLIMATIVMVACNQAGDEPTMGVEGHYEALGQLKSPLADSVYVSEGVKLESDVAKNGKLKITFNDIKFVPQMPMTLTFYLADVPYQVESGVIKFQADSVVPVMGMVPMATYIARDVKGEISADSLKCSSRIGNKYSFVYAGKLLKN